MYNNESTIKEVQINGNNLDLSKVIAVARYGAKVTLEESAKNTIIRCRDVVDVVVENNMVVYGISTGFGALRDRIIPHNQTVTLQKNLIRSHACGVGEPLSPEIARAAILLRANTLAKGNSGVRLNVIEKLLEMLDKGICPWIPSQGSVGASGDLCPLSHIVLVLIGDPSGKFIHWQPHTPYTTSKKIFQEEKILCSTPENLKKYGFTPIELSYKEGLGLNNGTQIMTAIACITLYDAYWLIRSAELATCMSFEGIQGIGTALDERIHQVRPFEEQIAVSKTIREYVQSSTILSTPMNGAILYAIKKEIEKLSKQDESKQEINDMFDEILQGINAIINEETMIAEKNPDLAWQISYNTKSLERAKKNQSKLQEKIIQTIEKLKQKESKSTKEQNITLSLEAILNEWKFGKFKKLVPQNCPTQDDYSFRCTPQVLASAWRTWKHAKEVVQTEINSATDNPLIFPPTMPDNTTNYREWLIQNPELCRQAVISGGNFHGEPIGMVMDYLAIGLAEVGNISERRTAHLVDNNHNNGLPAFLMESAGVNSGFMIPQYTAAALVSENKILSHPATVDSIPTSANTEDHVSMATIASRKCLQILENVTNIIAIEILTANQAIYLREFPAGKLAQTMQKKLQKAGIQHYEQDETWYPAIETIAKMIQEKTLFQTL